MEDEEKEFRENWEAKCIRAGELAVTRVLKATRRLWTDWILIIEALDAGRKQCQRVAKTNDVQSQRYRDEFGRWLIAHPKFDSPPVTKEVRKYCFDCADNLPAIKNWYATLTDNQRGRWVHPDTIFKQWKAATQVSEKVEKGPSKLESLAAMNAQLVEENDRLAARIKELEELQVASPVTKPPLEPENATTDGKWRRAYVDGRNACYEFRLQDGGTVSLSGGGMKSYRVWQVGKQLGEVQVPPYKSRPAGGKETDAERTKRQGENEKNREKGFAKALAIAQRDYDRYR